MECVVKISEDGTVDNVATVARFFKDLPAGSTGTLTWKPANLRSLGQNAYYWHIVVPLVRDGLRDIGFDGITNNDKAHGYLKDKFLKQYYHNKNNPEEVIELPGTTTELTTVQFMAFIAEVQQWASEWLGVIIPDPGEQLQAFE